MADSLEMTVAEMEFLLRLAQPEHVLVRELLDISHDDPDDAAVRGLASLLERGLCVRRGEDVRPIRKLGKIVAALADARVGTRALGAEGDRSVLVHILNGPTANLVLFPSGIGRMTVELLDSDAGVVDQLARFVDACLTPDASSTVVIQSTAGHSRVGIAVHARAGRWLVSDSEDSPERATPATRDEVVARIEELLPVGAR